MPSTKSRKSVKKRTKNWDNDYSKSNPADESVHSRLVVMEKKMARILEEMQERVHQVELISGFSAVLNSSLDPALVREKALEATCELVRCETASLFLVDHQKQELYWETAINDLGRELKKTVRLPMNDQSIAGYVAMTGESVLSNDVQSDQRHSAQKSKFKKGGFVTRTMICVPLVSKDRVLGVLQALNKTPGFSPDDLKLLQALSHQVAIAIENAKLYTDIKRNFYETVEAMAEAIEKKDRYTGGHTKRVVYYSMCIAKYLNLSEQELERIRLGAVLHDIGKIGIEDRILKKNSPLDQDEWQVMQKHPEIGFDIMNRVEGLRDVIGGMKSHHERWDGKGYPEGLVGEQIPLIARIISVADTYDAMVSTRPYRKGLPTQTAFEEITKHRATQFCPTVVDAFIQAFRNEKMGKGSGGSNYGHSGGYDPTEVQAAATNSDKV